MSEIVITGFRPYSLLTALAGNPSEVVATRLRERCGRRAHAEILDVDSSCLSTASSLARRRGVSAIVMFGADIQFAPLVLELEGVSKSNGLFDKKTVIQSPAAAAIKGVAESIGVPARTAPLSPLVYWCLRSYGAALEVANSRRIPCVFFHVNTLRTSSDVQVEKAYQLVERLMTAGRVG